MKKSSRIEKIVNENSSEEFRNEMLDKGRKQVLELLRENEGFVFINAHEGKACICCLSGWEQLNVYKFLIENIIPTLEKEFIDFKESDMIKLVKEHVKFPKNHQLDRS